VNKKIFRILALAIAGPLAGGTAWAVITVQTTDFIGSGYSKFNGFEGANPQSGGPYVGGYTEDGIDVDQVPACASGCSGFSIQTNSINDGLGNATFQGLQSWRPPFGDNRYTDITLSDGADFVDVGFLVGSMYTHPGQGSPSLFLYYQLLNNGVLVQDGTLVHQIAGYWLGFSGGGFDEIRLRDGDFYFNVLDTHTFMANGLIVDSIKTKGEAGPLPEPATLALLSLGLAGLGFSRRKQ